TAAPRLSTGWSRTPPPSRRRSRRARLLQSAGSRSASPAVRGFPCVGSDSLLESLPQGIELCASGRSGRALERWLRVVLDLLLHLAGEVFAPELPGQPERHVDARRHSGGGDEIAVVDVAVVLQHGHVAAAVAQGLDEGPVGGDALAAREPRLVQEQRAGAYARHPLRLRSGGAEELDHR